MLRAATAGRIERVARSALARMLAVAARARCGAKRCVRWGAARCAPWRVALQASGLLFEHDLFQNRCTLFGSRSSGAAAPAARRRGSIVVGSGFPEIGDARSHHVSHRRHRTRARCCTCGRASRAPRRSRGNDRLHSGSLRRLPADAAHAALSGEQPSYCSLEIPEAPPAGANDPLASSPSFCAAGARYPAPGGRRDGRGFWP